MAVEVRMPAYSESMEEADVVGWLVAPGDSVNEGDPIAEIETDKATGELEAPASGVISEILVAEGTQGVKVGELLARIEPAAAAATEAQGPESPAVLEDVDSGAPAGSDLASPTNAAPQPERAAAESESASARAPIASPAKPHPHRDAPASTSPAPVPATALARRLADRAGIELSSIPGSGASGRVLKADVEAVSAGQAGATPRSAAGRSSIAQPIPSSAVTRLRAECRADRAVTACERLSAREPATPIPMLSLILRAAAGALREVPEANLAWHGDDLVAPDTIAIAVGQATARGERVTLVRDADRMSLGALAQTLTLAETDATPAASETALAALALVHVGDANIESIQLAVSPPCVFALGTGAPSERPTVVDGALGVGVLMTCTLTADARAVEPASAARLFAAFKLRLEEPLEMVLQ